MNISSAIVAILDHKEVHHIGEYPHIRIGEALDLAIEALKEKAEQQWISVWDRLPENDSNKLYAERTVYNVVVYGNVSAAVFGSKCGKNVYDWWVDRRGYVVEGVTHWQPAPLPPKEV